MTMLLEGQREQEIAALFNMILDLTRQRPFLPDAVGRITGKVLQVDPLPSNPSFTEFRSDKNAEALLQAVHLSVPTSAGSKTDGSVILFVNTEARITPEAVRERFEFRPSPAPPSGEARITQEAVSEGCEGWVRTFDHWDPYHEHYCEVYRYCGGYVKFEFADRTHYLMSAAINAIQPQPIARPKHRAFWQPSEESQVLKDLREAIVSGKDMQHVREQVLKLPYGFTAPTEYDVRFPSPIAADAFCRCMGWERPYAVSTDVHQVSWYIALWIEDLEDPYGPCIDVECFPWLGKWRIRAALKGRPSGDLPGVRAGASPAYDLHRYSAEVVGLEIRRAC